MKRFVLDASIALSWFVDQPTHPEATRVRQLLLGGARALVPTLWHLEFVNGLQIAIKRYGFSMRDAEDVLLELDRIIMKSIDTTGDPIAMRRILAIARQFQLTSYDALYLDMAREHQLDLATLDQQLAKAARQAGIQTVQ